jgi:serine/threonine protein phosphatase 1
MLPWLKRNKGGDEPFLLRGKASIPAGERVYAIGDVHGRADLQRDLLQRLVTHAGDTSDAVTVVWLGDYIDRGPDSAAVVDNLLQSPLPAGWRQVFLRGNHEQALLDFLAEPTRNTAWLAWGGIMALQSYGVQPYGARGLREPAALAAELQHALAERGHAAFYAATKLTFECGDYVFVHAGVRPGVPLARQLPEDLLMIREDFMGRPHNLGKTVVFGHTIVPQVLQLDDRIGLDTGAFETGVLSAACLREADVLFLQTVQVKVDTDAA